MPVVENLKLTAEARLAAERAVSSAGSPQTKEQTDDTNAN